MAVLPLKNKNKRNARGFTLIEVLIAMAILGIALLAVTRAVGFAVKSNVYVNEKSFADWVAVDISAKVRAGIINIKAAGNTQNGSKQIMNHTFIWQLTSLKLADMPINKVNIRIYNEKQKMLTSAELFMPDTESIYGIY